MQKVDVFQKFEDTEMKRMQVVYLYDNGFSADEIHNWVDYAVSTIKGYVRKFSHLLEKAKKIFYHVSIKMKSEVKGPREQIYLAKFYDDEANLIFSKVGTTTRPPEARLREELRYYRKNGVTNGVMCSVIDCGDLPAEGAESITRAAFIKKYPKAYLRNDRFCKVDIAVRTFNKIVAGYLEPSEPEPEMA